MFGTFRFNHETNEQEHVTLSRADGMEARGYTRTACRSCRAQKLKCSGEPNGCRRCRAMSKTCAYDQSDLASSTPQVASARGAFDRLSSRPGTGVRQHSASSSRQILAPQILASATALGLDRTTLDSASINEQSGQDWGASHALIPSSTWSGSSAKASAIGSRASSSGSDAIDGQVQEANLLETTQTEGGLGRSPSGGSVMDFEAFLTSPISRGLADGLVADAAALPFGGEEFEMPGILSASPLWVQDPSGPPDAMVGHPNLPLSVVPASRPSMPTLSVSDSVSGERRQEAGPEGAASESSATAGHNRTLPTFTTVNQDTRQMPFGILAEDTCTCLDMTISLLEAMGDEEVCHTSEHIPESEVDVVLVFLDRGSQTFESVLNCERCNACSDNGMLIASIALRLCDATERAVSSITAGYHEQAGDPAVSQTRELLGGMITLGRLKISAPGISRKLVQQAVLAYVVSFQRCTQRMTEVIGEHKGAGKLLSEVGARTSKVVDGLERLHCNR